MFPQVSDEFPRTHEGTPAPEAGRAALRVADLAPAAVAPRHCQVVPRGMVEVRDAQEWLVGACASRDRNWWHLACLDLQLVKGHLHIRGGLEDREGAERLGGGKGESCHGECWGKGQQRGRWMCHEGSGGTSSGVWGKVSVPNPASKKRDVRRGSKALVWGVGHDTQGFVDADEAWMTVQVTVRSGVSRVVECLRNRTNHGWHTVTLVCGPAAKPHLIHR